MNPPERTPRTSFLTWALCELNPLELGGIIALVAVIAYLVIFRMIIPALP